MEVAKNQIRAGRMDEGIQQRREKVLDPIGIISQSARVALDDDDARLVGAEVERVPHVQFGALDVDVEEVDEADLVFPQDRLRRIAEPCEAWADARSWLARLRGLP